MITASSLDPGQSDQFQQAMVGELPAAWDAGIPIFPADPKGMAPRVASGKVLSAISANLPALIGGSADLDPSTHTALKALGDFENPRYEAGNLQGSAGGGWGYAGRNLHFGVREHAMGAIANGLAVHGGVIPFTATFFTFSDYMRPAIRLAALMEQGMTNVFTHDSLAVGEDGATHQPVEQLASLRAIPNLLVIRPGDAIIGVDCFGASAPGPIVMREYGISVDNVCQRALALLEREHV